jgi:hypothetical protein
VNKGIWYDEDQILNKFSFPHDAEYKFIEEWSEDMESIIKRLIITDKTG